MPTPLSSLVHNGHVVVRLRRTLFLTRRRLLTVHGQHGALYALLPADALRLVEAGHAKLPAGVRRQALRDHCARLEAMK